MATTAKKITPKPRKISRARRQSGKAKASRAKRTADLAERKKIGRTLDLAAFVAYQKKNTASMKYWQTRE